jgi:phosphomethylpyrimidine synthase
MNLNKKISNTLTSDLKIIAEREGISFQKLTRRIKSGRIMVLKNKKSKNPVPTAIGEGLRTKVNANIGLSTDLSDMKLELKKAKTIQKYGADLLMDLSSAKGTEDFSELLLKQVSIPVGVIPIYQLAVSSKKKFVDTTEDDFLNAIQKQARNGYDPLELHLSLTRSNLKELWKEDRSIKIVSRGGAMVARWMIANSKENPLYENFEYILEMAKDLNFSIGFVPTLRPGCLGDSLHTSYYNEIKIISELVQNALKSGVQVRIPGPNHMAMNEIQNFVKWEKETCHFVPLGSLGPVVTDVSIGFDHISHAIGAAISSSAGADYITAIYRSEHLGLPTIRDISEGILSSRIAAHAADISKNPEKWLEWDREIAEARAKLDWNSMLEKSICPNRAKRIWLRLNVKSEGCSICGDFCPIKSFYKFENIDK